LPIINEQLKDFKEDKNLVMYCTGEFVAKKASTLNTKVLRMFSAGRWYQLHKQIKEENLESKFIGKTLF
jgi:UPF0176 protein